MVGISLDISAMHEIICPQRTEMASRSGHLLKQQNHTVSSRWMILMLSRAIKNRARSIPKCFTFTHGVLQITERFAKCNKSESCRVQHYPSGHKGGYVAAEPSPQPSRRVLHTSLVRPSVSRVPATAGADTQMCDLPRPMRGED